MIGSWLWKKKKPIGSPEGSRQKLRHGERAKHADICTQLIKTPWGAGWLWPMRDSNPPASWTVTTGSKSLTGGTPAFELLRHESLNRVYSDAPSSGPNPVGGAGASKTNSPAGRDLKTRD